jgi:hypothetical protein
MGQPARLHASADQRHPQAVRDMKLYSVCPVCNDPDWQTPYDGSRLFGDLDRCAQCTAIMDVWTESGIRNEMLRRQWGISGQRCVM